MAAICSRIAWRSDERIRGVDERRRAFRALLRSRRSNLQLAARVLSTLLKEVVVLVAANE